jgi:malonyl CoA-acyl carrier protein transacylase
VGAAGFSVGGYTVAALAGARLDPQRVAAALTGAGAAATNSGVSWRVSGLTAEGRRGRYLGRR